MKWAIFYTILALILFIVGFITQEWAFLVCAIVVSACSFYWIWKAWRKN